MGSRRCARAEVRRTSPSSSDSESAPVEIEGRSLSFPIEVRAASSWAAQFVVDADAAQRMIEATGLSVVRAGPNRAVVSIVFVHYEDSDLDAYNEVGIGFFVRGRAGFGVYIHHLPVDQAFTLAAGRALWGYPKFLADISIEHGPTATACDLRHGGAGVLRLVVRDRGWLPLPARTPPTYTFLDGVLRWTAWEMPATRVRAHIGGATLTLGDHPIADELRALGLPKRALMTQSIPHMRARFGPAAVVG